MATPSSEARPTFATRLAAAMTANGLTSEDLQASLARDGAGATAPEIDRWRNGEGTPDSLATVSTLEGRLSLIPGALSAVTPRPEPDPGAGAGPLSAGGVAQPTEPQRLKLSFHPDALTWCRTVQAEQEVIHRTGRYISEIRMRRTLEILQEGVDSYLVVSRDDTMGSLVKHRAAPISGCRQGRVRMIPEENLICTELLLERPQSIGETPILEYAIVYDQPNLQSEFFYDSPTPIVFNTISVRFHEATLPERCLETISSGDGPPHVRELRLHGSQIRSTVTELPSVRHLVTWEW